MSRGPKKRGQRAEGTRRQNKVILVVGDGESEKVYFDRLSDLCGSVSIKSIAAKVNGTKKIVEKTRSIAKQFDISPSYGDVIAIVMDLDFRYTLEEITKMEGECETRGFKLFISNPCFEVWLLSHFRLLTHQYDQKEILIDLERELGRPYSKSTGMNIDDAMVDNAMKNAEKLLSECDCDLTACFQRNPSTMVQSLVESIRGMSRKKA